MKNKTWIMIGLIFVCLAVYALADGTIQTESGNLTLNPAGGRVLPGGDRQDYLGAYGRFWENGYFRGLYVYPERCDPSDKVSLYLNAGCNSNFTILDVGRKHQCSREPYAPLVYLHDDTSTCGYTNTVLQINNARGNDAIKITGGSLNMNGNQIKSAVLVTPKIYDYSHGYPTMLTVERRYAHMDGTGPTVMIKDSYSSSRGGPLLQLYNGRGHNALYVQYGSVNLGGNNLYNVGKITASKYDPIIKVGDDFYATWAPEGPAHEVQLSGTAKLSGGKAIIDFASAPEGTKGWLYSKIAVNVRAFVTPLGPCLLYVSEQGSGRVVVRSNDKKCREAEFNWRVIGDRLDNVVGDNTLAPEEELEDLAVALDTNLKEVIYRVPDEVEEKVVGYRKLLLKNGSVMEKPVKEKTPKKFKWVPESEHEEAMEEYREEISEDGLDEEFEDEVLYETYEAVEDEENAGEEVSDSTTTLPDESDEDASLSSLPPYQEDDGETASSSLPHYRGAYGG